MKNFFKKNDNLIVFILFFISAFLITFFTKVDIGDEIINFQSTMKIVNGYEMYSDFNVITTPLFFEIGAIFLKILGGNIFSFRIYNAVIFALLFLSIYRISKKVKFQKAFGLLITSFCFIIFWPYIKVGANYNTLALAMFLFGILNANSIIENIINEDNSKEDNSKEETNNNVKNSIIKKGLNKLKCFKIYILQGTIIFTIFFTKQNIGVYYIAALIVFNFCMLNRKIIPTIKLLAKECSAFFIETIILCIILLIKGSFFNMISYAFLGMKEFTKENFIMTKQGYNILIIYLIEIFFINVIYGVLIKEKSLKTTTEKSLIIFSIFLNLTNLPIINLYHMTYAITLNVIMIFIIIRTFCREYANENIKRKIKNSSIILLFIFYLTINISNIIIGLKFDKNEFELNKESVYYFSYMNTELKSKMDNICNFIIEAKEKGKTVIVFSNTAPLYMTNLKINNGDFDLPFSGNLGKNGANGLISKIDELEDTYILISNETYWQIPESAKTEIIKTSNKIDTIEDYTIYEK
jgi:hypothetical protein